MNGAPPAQSLRQMMSEHINPRLSELAILLYHDQRPADDIERRDETSRAAERLSECFAQLPAFYADANVPGNEFRQLSSMESFNASSLSHAAAAGDQSGQHHWFLHLKEVCDLCHTRYRFTSLSRRR